MRPFVVGNVLNVNTFTSEAIMQRQDELQQHALRMIRTRRIWSNRS